MAWDTYEVVVEERRLKYYKIRAQSAGHARSVFTKKVPQLMKGNDVVSAPTITVAIRSIRRLKELEDN